MLLTVYEDQRLRCLILLTGLNERSWIDDSPRSVEFEKLIVFHQIMS